jgi:hypothetical protein
MSLFLRNYELVIGLPGSLGVKITGLNISFDISKSDDSEQNTANIRVYNLNPEHRRLTEQDGVVVVLKAGYQERELKTIFTGDIITASTSRQGTDIVTEISCGDGYTPLLETRVNRSYPKGTPVQTVLEDIGGKDLGLPIGELNSAKLTQKCENGLSYMGDAYYVLDSICKPRHINWSIQDGQFYAIGTQKSSTEKRVFLSKDTGMIDSPERVVKKPGKRKSNPDPDGGVRVRSLLNPEIRPNKLIDIQGEFINNGQVMTLKVKKVTHRGEFEGGDWVTEVEAVEISGVD